MDIIAQLKAERDKAAQQVDALDTAIRALSGLNTTRPSLGPRRMSAAAKAKISASKKAWWAKRKGGNVVSIRPKRHISAAGLARIRAAQRARRAKLKAAKKLSPIPANRQPAKPSKGRSATRQQLRVSLPDVHAVS